MESRTNRGRKDRTARWLEQYIHFLRLRDFRVRVREGRWYLGHGQVGTEPASSKTRLAERPVFSRKALLAVARQGLSEASDDSARGRETLARNLPRGALRRCRNAVP